MSNPWVGKIPWRRQWLHTPVFWSREFHVLYSPWGCKKLDTICDPTEDLLEKGMANHSSILAWRIPRTVEPGRLWSMELQKSQTELGSYTTMTRERRLERRIRGSISGTQFLSHWQTGPGHLRIHPQRIVLHTLIA